MILKLTRRKANVLELTVENEWWDAMIAKTIRPLHEGYMYSRLRAIRTPGKEWLCTAETYEKVRAALKQYAHEARLDGYYFIQHEPLSPKQEIELWRTCPPSMRGEFLAECKCPPDVPRSVRREAERAWHKWVALRVSSLLQAK